MFRRFKSVLAFLLILFCCLSMTACGSKWEDYFDISYTGYFDYLTDNSYKEYNITNKTNYQLSDVTAVIHITTYVKKQVKFEKRIGTVEPHETIAFRLYTKDIYKALEENGIGTSLLDKYEIIEIKYKKTS